MRRIVLVLAVTTIALASVHAEQNGDTDVNADVFVAAGQNLTSGEVRVLEAVKGWADAWENDVGRMIDEFYAEQPEIYTPIQRWYWMKPGQSKDAWRAAEVEERKLEKQVHPDANSKMRFESILVRGNTVAILMETGRSAIFLEFDDDGKIQRDHSFFRGPTLGEMLADPNLLMSGTRVPGGRTPAFQAALEKMSEFNP